jgi:hypothetical protein
MGKMLTTFAFTSLPRALSFMAEAVIRAVVAGFCLVAVGWKFAHADGRGLLYLIALVCGLGVIYGLWWSRDRVSHRVWSVAGIGLLAAFAVGSIIWALAFSAPQITDNAALWKCGTEYTAPLSRWFDECRPTFLNLPAIYAERSFFYTLPFGRVFGANYPAFKLYNAVLHILAAVLIYSATVRWFGPRAGLVALTVLILHIEWTYHIAVASRDNLGVLVIIASMFMIAEYASAGARLVTLVILALVLFVSEWVRTIGVLGLLTTILAISFGPSDETASKRFLKIMSIVAAFVASSWFVRHAIGYTTDHDPFFLLGSFDLIVRPAQSAVILMEWHDHLSPAIDPLARAAFSLHRFLDELTVNYTSLLPYIADKIGQLTSGSLDLNFDIPPQIAPHVTYTAPINSAPKGPIVDAISATLPVFLFTVLGVAVLSHNRSVLSYVALSFLAIVLSVLLAVSGVLPYYLLALAPAAAIVIAGLAADFERGEAWDWAPPVRAIVGVGILGALWGGGYVATSLAKASSPRVLMEMTQESANAVPEVACNVHAVPIWPYFGRRMRSHFEPDVDCVSYRIPLSTGVRKVAFFVTRESFPMAPEKLPPVGFEYAFRIGSAPLAWRSLGEATAAWHAIDVPEAIGGEPALQFVVRRTRPGPVIEFEIRDLLESR